MRRRPALTALVLFLVASTAAPGQSVEVELESFGVGGVFRPGEHVGVRLKLTGTDLDEPMPVWVQIEVANPDGDIGDFGRSLALSPQQQLTTWITVPLPQDFETTSVLSVRVFEERDGDRQREIGGGRISPASGNATVVDPDAALLAVVGPSQAAMRLNDYVNPTRESGIPPRSAHEETRVVFGLQPEDLPDRWEALLPFEALAWGQHAPTELRDGQVRALREYIRRGGHLIVSLPPEIKAWGIGTAVGQNPLQDLLPTLEPDRQEGVPLEDLLPVVSKTRTLDLTSPIALTLHVFRRVGDGRELGNWYEPLIALDDGRIVAVQRTYGFGRITLIGFDLTNRQVVSGVPRAMQADVLWNRILGRRSDTPAADELQALEQSKLLSNAQSRRHNLGGGQVVGQHINMSETAGRGLGVALLLFIAYWVVACPGAYFALKHRRLERHSWIAFALATGLFTAAAWGVVSLIKPSDYRVKHLTFLDMLARPPGQDRGAGDEQLQRAVSYMTVTLPGYRRTPVFIESAPEQRDLLASWWPPPPVLGAQPFTNPDRYRVDVGNNPADLEQYLTRSQESPEYRRPTRATATIFAANWMGPLDRDRWGGTMRSHPDDPVRVIVDGGRERLAGSIVHDLPGELRDVTFIWVKGSRREELRYLRSGEQEEKWVPTMQSGRMLNNGRVWRKGGQTLSPGQAWSLVSGLEGEGSDLETTIESRYVDPYARDGFGLPSSTSYIRETDAFNYLEMLSFFNQLEPPAYLRSVGSREDEESVQFYRLLGRELDLSAWFTRPCLIVIGHLDGAALPIPLNVDGRTPQTDRTSHTVVRWICPFEMDGAMEEVVFGRGSVDGE